MLIRVPDPNSKITLRVWATWDISFPNYKAPHEGSSTHWGRLNRRTLEDEIDLVGLLRMLQDSHRPTNLFGYLLTEDVLCTVLLCSTLGPKYRSGIVPALRECSLL